MITKFLLACLASLVFLSPCFGEDSKKSEKDEEEARREMHYYLKGLYIFKSQCVPCHGKTGRGNGPWSEGLKDKPRNFRMGIFKFRTTPYGKLPTADDLKRTIRKGISGTAMPSFSKLTDSEVESLVVYLKNLSKRWDDPELIADPIPLPEIPEDFSNPKSREQRAANGKELFSVTCAVCHGKEGHGDGPGGKGLVDIWENPVNPGILSKAHHKSGDSPKDLYRTIATGLDGTPMVGFAETLNPNQIWNLVAWIKSIEGTAPDLKKKSE